MRCTCAYLLAALLLAGFGGLHAQEDTWANVTPMPTARESVAACALDGYIYAVGGFPGGSDAGLTTNERYDPDTNSWTSRAPMPTGRRMPVTGSVGGKCYAIGGRLTDGPRGLDVVEEYDPATNSWRTRTPMPTARFGHGAAVIDEIIYVVGGGERGIAYDTFEAYDATSDSWSTLPSLPSPRPLAGVAALNGKFYVIGGLAGFQNGSGNGYGTTRVDRYDPATNTWTRVANLPEPLFGLSASAAKGRIYAIGGADGPGAVNDVLAYDPAIDQWTVVSPMLTRRTRFASAVLNDRLYAIGGTVSFDTPHVGMDLVERYVPQDTGQQTFVPNTGLTDAWFDPENPGQGFFIVFFPDAELIFLSWFTYETDSRPANPPTARLGEPYHRWLTALGGWQGNTAMLDVTMTSGGLFDNPAPVTNTPPESYGTIEIRFEDCNAAVLAYDLFAIGESGEIPITRITTDRVSLCEALN